MPTAFATESRAARRSPARLVAEEVASLASAAAAGDQRAWERLVEEYSGLVWAVTRAHRVHENPMPCARDDAVACTFAVRARTRGTAQRVAAAVVKPPALRRMAVRVELLGLGTGLTAKDKVNDAEPW